VYKFRNYARVQKEQTRSMLKTIDSVLDQYFAVPRARLDKIDVAEFFTVVEMLGESPWLMQRQRSSAPSDGPLTRSPSQSLFADLAALTRTYFFSIGEMEDPPPDIHSLIEGLRPNRDAIVSFNWDEELDLNIPKKADRRDVAYTLGAWRPDKRYLVLKPHGSVGWYDVSRGIGNDGIYFIAENDERIPRPRRRIVSYWGHELPCDIEASLDERRSRGKRVIHPPLGCPPVITAPTFAKKFEYQEQHCIWQDVLTVCREAREFVFLGYSLPKDDFLTRAAIRAALRDNERRQGLRCLIVDRELDALKEENFRSVFGPKLSKGRNYLEWTFGDADGSCKKLDLPPASLAALIDRRVKEAIL
jgi:hypothetical protein